MTTGNGGYLSPVKRRPVNQATFPDSTEGDEGWESSAAPYPAVDGSQPCLEVDADLFFPEVGVGGTLIAQTVAVCRSCPFMADCLDYALTHDVAGIWGGTTPPHRRELRRRYGIRARVVSADRFLPTEARVAS